MAPFCYDSRDVFWARAPSKRYYFIILILQHLRFRIIKQWATCHMVSRNPKPYFPTWINVESFSNFSCMFLKSVSPKRVVTILYHCAFNADFLANSYFISKICHAKSFKMRYIMSLYKPFWKYESWFCSEVSKLTLSNYPWNNAFSGRKKNMLTNNIS